MNNGSMYVSREYKRRGYSVAVRNRTASAVAGTDQSAMKNTNGEVLEKKKRTVSDTGQPVLQ